MHAFRYPVYALVMLFLPGLPLVAGQPGADPGSDRAALQEKWRNASTADLVAALNRLADESIQRTHAWTDRERILQEAWRDPAHSSEQIEALRIRMQELEHELLETRRKLQEAVFALPPLRELREGLEAERRDIEAMRAEREVVQRLLHERRQVGRD